MINLGFVLSFWAFAGAILLPYHQALMAMPPQTGTEVCLGFSLPPSSPELDAILEAQAAISEAVFPAGEANFLYCEEGTWLLDEELDESKEIQSDLDLPISGVTYGGDEFLIYPYFVLDVDLLDLAQDLTPEELQWAQGENLQMSFVAGVIETELGHSGFYGWYTGADDAADNRLRTLVPMETTTAVDFAHLVYNGETPLGQQYTGPLGTCIQVELNNYNLAKNICGVGFGVCIGLATIKMAAGLIRCAIAASAGFTVPLSFMCSITVMILYGQLLAGCAAIFAGCMAIANLTLQNAIDNCLLTNP